MKNIFRHLVSGFSGMKGFDGWLIAKIRLSIMEANQARDTETDADLRVNTDVVKSKKSHAVLNARMAYNDRQFSMELLLLKPKGSNSERQSASGENNREYFFSLQYDIHDINRFTEEVGDYNSIHRTNNPIVPGFMLFEDMLGHIAESRADILETPVPMQISMLFLNPAFAEEKIYVYKALAGDKRISNSEYMAYSDSGAQIFTFFAQEA